jgi:hypothetical protein
MRALLLMSTLASLGCADVFELEMAIRDLSGDAVVRIDGEKLARGSRAPGRYFIYERLYPSHADALASPPLTIEAWRGGVRVSHGLLAPGEACRDLCRTTCGDVVFEQREDVAVFEDGALRRRDSGCIVCRGHTGTWLHVCL